MKKKITLGKILMIMLICGLSFIILLYNDTLRVPSIFDGRLYSSARIDKAKVPVVLPEKPTALPDMALWDSADAATYQYPDFFLQNTSTTSFLVLRNDTV